MATKLFVGGLPYSTKDNELEELFANYGTVVSASVIQDKISGRSKGFGFVELETAEEAQAAIDALNDKEFGGRNIAVSLAREKTEGDRRGGNRSGGFRGGNGGGYRGNNGGGNSFRFR